MVRPIGSNSTGRRRSRSPVSLEGPFVKVKRWKIWLFIVTALAVVASRTAIAQSSTSAMPAARASSKAGATIVDLAVVNGRLSAANDTLRVKQGESIALRWTSDKPLNLHLHGYDIELKVPPNTPTTMSFVAKIPGRFPVSDHGQGTTHQHHALAYLEVLP
jgi:FtsP/CotA-like multicopper oxidase with cupredoxin domain